MSEATGYSMVEAPTERPLLLADVKRHSVIEHDDDDFLLYTMMDAAESYASEYMNRQILDAGFEAFYSSFEDGMELPVYRPTSVTEITYYDENNALQTLDSSVYEVRILSTPSVVKLAYSQEFPSTYDRADAVKIAFRAGYATRASVPSAIKIGLLMLVRQYDEYREGTMLKNVGEVPASVHAHFDRFRHYVVR